MKITYFSEGLSSNCNSVDCMYKTVDSLKFGFVVSTLSCFTVKMSFENSLFFDL